MSVLVLLHGFSGAPSSWDAVVARLPKSLRVVRPTLGGHAGVAPPVSFEAEVDRLAGEIKKQAPGAHLVGYSLGGRLAVGLLSLHPELFARATLIGANFGLTSDAERALRAKQDDAWGDQIEAEGLPAFVARWEEQPIFATQQSVGDEALDRQRAVRLSHEPRGLAGAMRALSLGRMPNYEQAIGAADLPVTLVTGDLDQKFTDLAKQIVPTLRRGNLRIVLGAGHNVPLERPEALSRLLLE